MPSTCIINVAEEYRQRQQYQRHQPAWRNMYQPWQHQQQRQPAISLCSGRKLYHRIGVCKQPMA